MQVSKETRLIKGAWLAGKYGVAGRALTKELEEMGDIASSHLSDWCDLGKVN